MSNIIIRIATPFTSTQYSKLGIELRGLSEYFKLHGNFHNFFIKALIKILRGVVNLKRV